MDVPGPSILLQGGQAHSSQRDIIVGVLPLNWKQLPTQAGVSPGLWVASPRELHGAGWKPRDGGHRKGPTQRVACSCQALGHTTEGTTLRVFKGMRLSLSHKVQNRSYSSRPQQSGVPAEAPRRWGPSLLPPVVPLLLGCSLTLTVKAASHSVRAAARGREEGQSRPGSELSSLQPQRSCPSGKRGTIIIQAAICPPKTWRFREGENRCGENGQSRPPRPVPSPAHGDCAGVRTDEPAGGVPSERGTVRAGPRGPFVRVVIKDTGPVLRLVIL